MAPPSPYARAGLQKQFLLKNMVLFFNFQAICTRVSVVYLASTLVFTYLFKEKNSLVWFMDCSNFPCCAPNLKGYRERSHWPYKHHGPSTETGWRFIFLKICQVGLHWKSIMICKVYGFENIFDLIVCFNAERVRERERERKRPYSLAVRLLRSNWDKVTQEVERGHYHQDRSSAGWMTASQCRLFTNDGEASSPLFS